MPIYKKFNKDFFKKWTPEMAYVLGFFMADGYMSVNSRGSEYFAIQITDKNILEKIKKIINSEHKISKRIRKPTERPIFRLQIGSKEVCEDLRKLGVEELKTKTMRLPDIPNKYLGDFIRGYFDGDGNVWVGFVNKYRKTKTFVIHSAFTSCSKGFLIDLRNKLSGINFGEGSLYKTKKNAYVLKYSVKSSTLLYKLIYDNLKSDLFLNRKKKVFEKYLKIKNAVVV
ncbi:MAG: hypothetical protein Athens071416_376 [Parcubacteria group bacterium Athens0714_16]|nr:MAG: hypothetical protein Athens071416_376 [Parcubacteria group bacterium Athens0714_16]